MFVCCCLGTTDPTCPDAKGEEACMCTGASCTCSKEGVSCEFADNKLKCSWKEEACPEIDCTAPADDAKTAICGKEGNDPDTPILTAMNDDGAACSGMTSACTATIDEGSETSDGKGKNEDATTVDNSVPASKDGDTNSEDPAGACNESCHDSLATSYSHSLTQSDRLFLTHCIHLPADCTTRRTNERTTGHSCKIVQMKIKNVKNVQKRDRN